MKATCQERVSWMGRSAPLLTWTTAMQAWSWSLPAGDRRTCPAALPGPGSVCGSCYAQTGRFIYGSVARAQWVRYHWVSAGLRVRFSLAQYMARVIGGYCTNGYLRVHDSGDFFSREYVGLWMDIATLCPAVRFWFPTRTWRFPAWLPALRQLAALPNVVVRPSALCHDEAAPVVDGLAAGNAVPRQLSRGVKRSDKHMSVEGRMHTICPKSHGSHNCQRAGCRRCWDSPAEQMAVLFHGHDVTDKCRAVRARHAAELTTGGS